MTLGSISAGGGVFVASTALTSARPNAVRRQLIRTIRSTPSSAWGEANRAMPFCRASSLSLGAMPSSSSTQTMSVPQARALGYISGLRPGAKIKVRRGRMVCSLVVMALSRSNVEAVVSTKDYPLSSII